MTDKKTAKRWNYSLELEANFREDTGGYFSYGIKVTDAELSGTDFGYVLHDVSVFKDEVASLTARFNEYQLSPIHLKEAVEDLLL